MKSPAHIRFASNNHVSNEAEQSLLHLYSGIIRPQSSQWSEFRRCHTHTDANEVAAPAVSTTNTRLVSVMNSVR